MSYARFSADSDVYVYLHVNRYFECCGCALSSSWEHKDTDTILEHLEQHKKAGHQVPLYCIENIIADREGNEAYING